MPDADLNQKVLLKRLLWSAGNYSRIDVDLSVAEYGDVFKRQPLTDIDVLSFSVSPTFALSTTIADCKTNQRDPVIGRIFWVNGVMNYFGSTEGIVVHKRINEPAKELASRLGVTLMSEDGLAKAHDRLRIDGSDTWNIFDPLLFTRLRTDASKINDELRTIYLYIRFRYWMYDANRNLLNIIALLNRGSAKLNPSDELHRYLVYDLICLFSLCLMKLCRYITSRDLADLEKSSRFWLHGGPENVTEKTSQINLVNQIVASTSGQSSIFHPMRLDPDYWPELLEVVNRLLERPAEASQVLRHADVTLYENVLGNASDISPYLGSDFSLMSLKLLKDIANFCVKAGKINPAFLDSLNAL